MRGEKRLTREDLLLKIARGDGQYWEQMAGTRQAAETMYGGIADVVIELLVEAWGEGWAAKEEGIVVCHYAYLNDDREPLSVPAPIIDGEYATNLPTSRLEALQDLMRTNKQRRDENIKETQ